MTPACTVRNPVGYQRSFLEDYEPGVTFYLSERLCAQFHEMGRTPANQQVAGPYARENLHRLQRCPVSAEIVGI